MEWKELKPLAFREKLERGTVGGLTMPPKSASVTAYFGDAVLNAGFLVVPHLLIRHYAEFEITAEQLAFLLQLLEIRWNLADPPRDLSDIAKRMGSGLSSVRRHSANLHE